MRGSFARKSAERTSGNRGHAPEVVVGRCVALLRIEGLEFSSQPAPCLRLRLHPCDAAEGLLSRPTWSTHPFLMNRPSVTPSFAVPRCLQWT